MYKEIKGVHSTILSEDNSTLTLISQKTIKTENKV